MPDEHCEIDQCDVPKERHHALRCFREKRLVWLAWLDKDEHHAIWQTLNGLVWREVAFKSLTALALCYDEKTRSITLPSARR